MEALIDQAKAYVKTYMTQYDASHDYSHIERVLGLATHIHRAEVSRDPAAKLDGDKVTLAALLHDVGDKKYVKPGQDPTTMVKDFLLSIDCPADLASEIQLICSNVSYSNEAKNPEKVASLCDEHPELAVVQDADRLDAIGAVGIARMFAFTGAKASDRGLSTVHFHEKLLLIQDKMKTTTGREMAKVRTERMREYLGWWGEETGTNGGATANGHAA